MTNNNEDFMLTTFDNPFNPFDDFEIWWKTDMLLGYDSCGLLAKTALTSDVWSDEKNEEEIDRAMNEICENNPTIYRKVKRNDYRRSA